MLFREPERGAIDVNILICAFPPALHPTDQPAVPRPPAFPVLRFPPGQFRLEPCAILEQRSNPPPHLDLPRTLRRNPRKNLEQSRFTRPIPPDDAQDLPPLHLKRNILQSVDPIRRRLRLRRRDERRGSRVEGFRIRLFFRRAWGIRRANKRCVFGIPRKLACGGIWKLSASLACQAQPCGSLGALCVLCG